MTTELTAYDYCQETINLKNAVEKNYLVLCARLQNIKEGGLYEANYGSWELFLEEVRINKRQAEAMIKIYQKFVIELGISEEKVALAGGWTVAETILPIATNKEEAEEALDYASHALRKDVRLYVQDKLHGGYEHQKPICNHEDYYTVIICRCCGERWQDYKDFEKAHPDATK